jgi:hypothetical protein
MSSFTTMDRSSVFKRSRCRRFEGFSAWRGLASPALVSPSSGVNGYDCPPGQYPLADQRPPNAIERGHAQPVRSVVLLERPPSLAASSWRSRSRRSPGVRFWCRAVIDRCPPSRRHAAGKLRPVRSGRKERAYQRAHDSRTMLPGQSPAPKRHQ